MEKRVILIVEDDPNVGESIRSFLEKRGYSILLASNGKEALPLFRQEMVDLVITDLVMPKMDGMALLEAVKKLKPETEVIVISAQGTIEKAVQAMKMGAFDFIEKPVEEAKLLSVVESALLKGAELHDPLMGKPLTRTERIVLCLILEGISNKRIAYILERSERTIEVHRSRVMRQLGVDNVVDLVKKSTAMGWTE